MLHKITNIIRGIQDFDYDNMKTNRSTRQINGKTIPYVDFTLAA